MEFHSHNRAPLSVLLLTGILLAYGIGYLEPGHAHHHHGHANDSAESVHGLHNEAAPTTESQSHDGERNHSH
jgi:zinc and cadmium transporter